MRTFFLLLAIIEQRLLRNINIKRSVLSIKKATYYEENGRGIGNVDKTE